MLEFDYEGLVEEAVSQEAGAGSNGGEHEEGAPVETEQARMAERTRGQRNHPRRRRLALTLEAGAARCQCSATTLELYREAMNPTGYATQPKGNGIPAPAQHLDHAINTGIAINA